MVPQGDPLLRVPFHLSCTSLKSMVCSHMYLDSHQNLTLWPLTRDLPAPTTSSAHRTSSDAMVQVPGVRADCWPGVGLGLPWDSALLNVPIVALGLGWHWAPLWLPRLACYVPSGGSQYPACWVCSSFSLPSTAHPPLPFPRWSP